MPDATPALLNPHNDWLHTTRQSTVVAESYRPTFQYTTALDTPALSPSRSNSISPSEIMSASTIPYGEGLIPTSLSTSTSGQIPLQSAVSRTLYASSTDRINYSTYSAQFSSVSNPAKSTESQKSYVTQSEASSQAKKNDNLSIPPTVQVPQHDLSQLAAEVACFFWFEPGTMIQVMEKSSSLPNSPMLLSSPLPLSSHVVPSDAFRKWLTGLLQTTQVTQNVIILALLFIYRLKRINPKVEGKPGSEFRLMTVALMLGNKFLDDNTYTNKTWAEVSGISVHEVHAMEVEFLSNMRFSLFTTEQEWLRWHSTLSKFGRGVASFIQRQETGTKPGLLAPLSSPSRLHNSSVSSPSNTKANGYHNYNHYNAPSLTPTLIPQSISPAVSPISTLPERHASLSRKRHLDEQLDEQPMKRHMAHFSVAPTLPSMAAMQNARITAAGVTRISLPSLTIPQQPVNLPIMHNVPAQHSRAMAMVYPPTAQRQTMPMSQMRIPPIQTSSIITPSSSSLGVYDPVRQITPYPISATSSPISANPHTSHLSPSFLLQQRSSPYRPVRQVKTLLNPPQAPTSIYNAPQQVGMEHLQYHSLGQPLKERHVGQVPYFHREAWPSLNQPRQWPQMMPPGYYMPS